MYNRNYLEALFKIAYAYDLTTSEASDRIRSVLHDYVDSFSDIKSPNYLKLMMYASSVDVPKKNLYLGCPPDKLIEKLYNIAGNAGVELNQVLQAMDILSLKAYNKKLAHIKYPCWVEVAEKVIVSQPKKDENKKGMI